MPRMTPPGYYDSDKPPTKVQMFVGKNLITGSFAVAGTFLLGPLGTVAGGMLGSYVGGRIERSNDTLIAERKAKGLDNG